MEPHSKMRWPVRTVQMTKNRPEGGLQMAYRIIHHVQWQYHTLSLVNKLPVGAL